MFLYCSECVEPITVDEDEVDYRWQCESCGEHNYWEEN